MMQTQRLRCAMVAVLLAGAAFVVFDGPAFAQTAGAPAGARRAAPEPGVLVVAVEPDSPAAQAGVGRGDIIVAVGEAEVNLPHELLAAIHASPADQMLKLTVLHGDEQRVLDIRLAERNGQPFLGVMPFAAPDQRVIISRSTGAMPEPDMHVFLAPRAGDGVLTSVVSATNTVQIIEVLPGSPAAEAGLQPGDMILAIDGEAVQPGQELTTQVASHKPGDQLVLEVQRGPAERDRLEISVTLAARPDNAAAAYLGVRAAPFVTMHHSRPAMPGEAVPQADFFRFRGQRQRRPFWHSPLMPPPPAPPMWMPPPLFGAPYGDGAPALPVTPYSTPYMMPYMPPYMMYYMPPMMMPPAFQMATPVPPPDDPGEQDFQFFTRPVPGAQSNQFEFQFAPGDQSPQGMPATPMQWQAEVQDFI